ncbi:MAG: hypothetical protein WD970_01945 [Patescibacteria group bacterium]
MLKILYVIAIGLLFAGVVGLGVSAFYPSPEFPECARSEPKIAADGTDIQPSASETAECRAAQDAWQKQQENHQLYSSMIYLAMAVIVIVVSMFGLGKIEIIGDGITLGGVFTLFVGLFMSFDSGNDIYRFLAVLFGLVVVIVLSYWKFLRPEKESGPVTSL